MERAVYIYLRVYTRFQLSSIFTLSLLQMCFVLHKESPDRPLVELESQ
jgi:hypothetical protein